MTSKNWSLLSFLQTLPVSQAAPTRHDTGMATLRSTTTTRLRHCADCDQHYETRDRLCPTCGAAFVPTANPSAQPDPWFAGGGYPGDDLPISRPEREAQQQFGDAAWLEGRPDINNLPEAMQQRILELINGHGLDVEGREGGPGERNGLSEEDIAKLPLSQLHTTSSMLMSGTLVCRACLRLSVGSESALNRQTSYPPILFFHSLHLLSQ